MTALWEHYVLFRINTYYLDELRNSSRITILFCYGFFKHVSSHALSGRGNYVIAAHDRVSFIFVLSLYIRKGSWNCKWPIYETESDHRNVKLHVYRIINLVNNVVRTASWARRVAQNILHYYIRSGLLISRYEVNSENQNICF